LLRVRVIYSYIDGNRAKNASIFSVLFCPLKYSNQTPAAERIFCRKRGYGTPSARGGKDIRAAADSQSKKVKQATESFDISIVIDTLKFCVELGLRKEYNLSINIK
jgi:hypothetical protein